MLETIIICVGDFALIGSIGSRPYVVPMIHSKVLLSSVGLKEKEFALIEKNADHKKLFEFARSATISLEEYVKRKNRRAF